MAVGRDRGTRTVDVLRAYGPGSIEDIRAWSATYQPNFALAGPRPGAFGLRAGPEVAEAEGGIGSWLYRQLHSQPNGFNMLGECSKAASGQVILLRKEKGRCRAVRRRGSEEHVFPAFKAWAAGALGRWGKPGQHAARLGVAPDSLSRVLVASSARQPCQPCPPCLTSPARPCPARDNRHQEPLAVRAVQSPSRPRGKNAVLRGCSARLVPQASFCGFSFSFRRRARMSPLFALSRVCGTGKGLVEILLFCKAVDDKNNE